MSRARKPLAVALGVAVTTGYASASAIVSHEDGHKNSTKAVGFILPPKAQADKINSFGNFLKAISDNRIRQQLTEENSSLTPEMQDVLRMINDPDYQQLVTQVNTVLGKYRIGEVGPDELQAKSKELSDFMKLHYGKGYEALKRNYIEFAKNNGYVVSDRDDLSINPMLERVGAGIQTPEAAYVGANTIAVANIFAVVNVSIWSNALAVVLLVAI